MAGCDELAKSPPGRAEGVELIHGEAVFGVGALEIREFHQKLIHNFGIDRLIDPRDDLNIARIEANLPFVRRRDHDLSTYEFAPVHVIAESRGEKPDAIFTLAKDLVRLLEGGDSSPLEVARVGRDRIHFRLNLEPVVEASHHDGADGTHRGNVLALGLPAVQTAFDSFRDGNALRKRETNRGVDTDAAMRGLFNRCD